MVVHFHCQGCLPASTSVETHVDLDLLLLRLALGFYLLGLMLAFTALLAAKQRLLRWLPVAAAPGLALDLVSLVGLSQIQRMCGIAHGKCHGVRASVR